MESPKRHTVTFWIVAVALTGIFAFLILFLDKKWKGMPMEKRISFKKGCVRDFKIACVLTLIVTIILIMTDHL